MDKILITYRGGYGDIYSILSYLDAIPSSAKITFLVEREHAFLSNIYKNIKFILNPIYKLIDVTSPDAIKDFKESTFEHLRIKETVAGFSQDRYDDSVVEVAFYIMSLYRPYYEFYKKLVDSHDLIITNYLDLTCINACLNSNREWWQVRSWYKWREDLPHVNLLNICSPYKNMYYYEREWIKGYETDPHGIYSYKDTRFFHNVTFKFKKEIDKLKIDTPSNDFEKSIRKYEGQKIFFATLGSMTKHNLKIGSEIKFRFIKKLMELFEDGWVGITTKREYDVFLRNVKNEKFVYMIDEWFPHDIIMKYVSLFLTHGGAGTFSRIIKENKEAWVFPFQLDQFYFGDIIEKHYGGKMFP